MLGRQHVGQLLLHRQVLHAKLGRRLCKHMRRQSSAHAEMRLDQNEALVPVTARIHICAVCSTLYSV